MVDDKFILMGIDDERSGQMAEILKSKTAKKILDFLADVKEASEKDIADGLKTPINTIEYNLKKLIKTGLVISSKNYFWSVKGKKIPMYQLAKKHVIISPSKKPNLSYIKTLLPVILVATLVLFLATMVTFQDNSTLKQTELNRFSSYDELTNFLKQNSENNEYLGEIFARGMSEDRILTATSGAESAPQSSDALSKATDFSTTNIQVEGVDEADIVKNDGKYIYLVSNSKLFIINAYPPEDMEILSETKLNTESYNLFINDDKLIVLSNDYPSYKTFAPEVSCIGCSPYYSTPRTIISIYNIENKQNPELEDTFTVDGNYVNSRMIGGYIYTISTKYIYTTSPELPISTINGIEETARASDIYYFDYSDTNYVFTTIASINIKNQKLNSEIYLTGGTSTVYVSQDNIYLTYQKRINQEYYLENYVKEVALPIMPNEQDSKINEILDSDKRDYEKQGLINKIIFDYSFSLKGQEKADFDEEFKTLTEEFEIKIQKQMEKTIVHKINIDEEKINYEGSGEVPGRVLNQFSIDEYNDNLRITTTTGNTWQGTSLNHLYILNKDLKVIGSVEDLAKGEQIFSTRFLGNRAYVVTFKQVDPLFVIDLSNPKAPEVLGYLKVTGFSNYLHPYDENHIIGVGKEATEQGRAQGVKIALFDVSNVQNPVEISKYEVGKEWSDAFQSYSDSEALYEHKAFLFDKEKELLVLPISYTKYIDNNWQNYEFFQGAYVFNIDLDGITLRGKITHDQDNESNQQWNNQVRRSLFIDDTVYTISNTIVQANNLNTLEKINRIDLGFEEPILYYTKGRIEGVAVAGSSGSSTAVIESDVV